MPKVKQPSMRRMKRALGNDLSYVRLSGAVIYLGPWQSEEAAQKYNRAIAEWADNGKQRG